MTRPWALVLLAVAAVAVVVQNVLFFMGDSPAMPAATAGASAAASATLAERSAVLETVPAVRALGFVRGLGTPEDARNPFLTRGEYESLLAGRMSVQQRREAGPPALDGTLISADRRVAWIDGMPLSEGDLVRGFELVRIGDEVVELRDESRHLRVEIESAPAAPGFWDDELQSEEEGS